MPYCPNCRTEYVGAAERCTDCGAELVATPPQGWQATSDADAMRPAELCELTDMVALDLLEAQLRAAGIPTARRPRRLALFVPTSHLESARRVMEGRPVGPMPETAALSELHRIRLVCEECDKETRVDLLEERVPEVCSCGHRFDLGSARAVLDRYAEVMRSLADADFDIEVEIPRPEP